MSWDAIVIGSGFGGAMAAWPLVQAGQRVLMLERGGWVGRGPDNWSDRGAGLITPSYNRETPLDVTAGSKRYTAGSWNCVGGQSVYYGGASFRFRPTDFEPNARIVGDSGAAWPFRYDDLDPFYQLAERLLNVDPGRAPLSGSSARIADAGRRAGLTPARIPLAISFDGSDATRACTRCGTCDGYACAAEAKNDLATGVIPRLVRQGMALRANTVVVRLVRSGSRISAVECVDRIDGQRHVFEAKNVILGAGTLATPHILLASNLTRVNPAGDAVGRYLTRHKNAIVFGLFARQPNPRQEFDKQVVFLDHYEEAGSIQQLTPPLGLVKSYLPRGLRAAGARFVSHASGLIVIAEDQPRAENGVVIDWKRTDQFGLPRLAVHHSYTRADDEAAAILTRSARRILREAGARLFWTHSIETFSHALGTVRMGVDEHTAPLDGEGRYRGLENLYVTDGSALPRSAGLNPSLSHRGERVAYRLPPRRPDARSQWALPAHDLGFHSHSHFHRPSSMTSILIGAGIGALSGLHASIWGMYKDAVHEGFGWLRFFRSVIIGAGCGVVIQAVLALDVSAPAMLFLLFGLTYAAERGIVETWKTFFRDEDQSKYFIPMQFSVGGRPVKSPGLRMLAGVGYIAIVGLCLRGINALDHRLEASVLTAGAAGFIVGIVIAIGGGWKGAPKEGFDLLKFFRSPTMTVVYALLLSAFTSRHLLIAVASIGFERATAETWKTFFFPSKPRGKFAGKPVTHPRMLEHRQWFIAPYAAIWIAVVAMAAMAFTHPASTFLAQVLP